MQRSADSPGVLVFPPLLFGSMLAIGILLHWFQPVPLLRPLVARLFGLGLLILSGVLARSAERAMKRAGTNIRPDQPTLAIVTDGPFRWTRNPLYLALLCALAGFGWLLDSAWMLLLVPVLALLLDRLVIVREEARLLAQFGDDYRAYCRRVRRWF